MSTLFYVTVFHALGVYSTPWSHRVEEGPHPIEVLQVYHSSQIDSKPRVYSGGKQEKLNFVTNEKCNLS